MKFDYMKMLIALSMALHLVGCSKDDSNDNPGTVTLDWAPPLQRADGSSLSPADIGGYRVYYGTTPGNYTKRVDVFDSTSQEATVTAAHGLYYYVITCFDTTGRESEFSPESSISI